MKTSSFPPWKFCCVWYINLQTVSYIANHRKYWIFAYKVCVYCWICPSYIYAYVAMYEHMYSVCMVISLYYVGTNFPEWWTLSFSEFMILTTEMFTIYHSIYAQIVLFWCRKFNTCSISTFVWDHKPCFLMYLCNMLKYLAGRQLHMLLLMPWTLEYSYLLQVPLRSPTDLRLAARTIHDT